MSSRLSLIGNYFLLIMVTCTNDVVGCTQSTPEDCGEIKLSNSSASKGIYTIKLLDRPCGSTMLGATTSLVENRNYLCCVEVYCDMDTLGGGWTVFQRRFDGSVDFYRTWIEYQVGFGSLRGEFYMGNEFLYNFTARTRKYELFVELDQGDVNCSLYAHYSWFKITDNNNYNLSLGSYYGTAGDALSYHNNMTFSTYDIGSEVNCAVSFRGAWWYKTCHWSNLNGEYFDGCSSAYATRITWSTSRGQFYSFKGSEMKLRPAGYSFNYSKQNSQLCDRDFTPPQCPEACNELTPENCAEIKMTNHSAVTGIYTIKVMNLSCGDVPGNGGRTGRCCVEVYCDMDRFGGGWTVFQRRYNGAVNFYKNWMHYERGFGSLHSEFYMGNKFLYYFTGRKTYELLVELDQSVENCSVYAHYSSFSIADSLNYTLSLGSYISGTAGDSLRGHSNRAFSTYDRDNDNCRSNCAKSYKGAWWYNCCHSSNLNGEYFDGCSSVYASYISWFMSRGYYYSFKGSEIKLRPAGYRIDCHWNPWSSWTTCRAANSTATYGEMVRNRSKIPAFGDVDYMDCQGKAWESKLCNIHTTSSLQGLSSLENYTGLANLWVVSTTTTLSVLSTSSHSTSVISTSFSSTSVLSASSSSSPSSTVAYTSFTSSFTEFVTSSVSPNAILAQTETMTPQTTTTINLVPTTPEYPLSQFEEVVATTVQSLGCTIILASIVITLIAFLILRDFSDERCLHMNQEIALLIAHILILTLRNRTDLEVPCKVTSAVLQLSFTAVFTFMTLEALQTYTIMTKVIRKGGYLTKPQNFVIGWGGPAVITGTTAIFKHYEYSSRWSCWLNVDSTPVAMATLGPIISLAAATMVLTEAASMEEYPDLPGRNPHQVTAASANHKGMVFLLPLNLGSMFIGFYAVFHANIALYSIVFAFNTALGISIFGFHSLGNPKVHLIFKKTMAKSF